MPRICTICAHAERHAIDKALAGGESCRTIASRYGTIGRMALERHKDTHLPAKLVRAEAAADVAEADDLLSQVRDLQRITMALLARAVKADDLRSALQAVGQARGNLELLGKLLGELERTQVNVLVTPEWQQLRDVILTTLRPHPAALETLRDTLTGR